MNVWIDVHLVLFSAEAILRQSSLKGRLWCDIATYGRISYKNRSNHCNNYSGYWFVTSFSDICVVEKVNTMLKQILLIWLYFSALPLFGQSLIDIKYYSVQDGLSQKNIQNFIQDDNGYIWMATWNGLERFDGYSFTNYKTYPESDVRITNHRFTNIEKVL